MSSTVHRPPSSSLLNRLGHFFPAPMAPPRLVLFVTAHCRSSSLFTIVLVYCTIAFLCLLFFALFHCLLLPLCHRFQAHCSSFARQLMCIAATPPEPTHGRLSSEFRRGGVSAIALFPYPEHRPALSVRFSRGLLEPRTSPILVRLPRGSSNLAMPNSPA